MCMRYVGERQMQSWLPDKWQRYPLTRMLISTVWRLSTRVSAIAMNRSAGWKKLINNALPDWFIWLLTHSGMGYAPTRATPICFAGWDCRSDTLIRENSYPQIYP